jgi:hypothetical protein
LAQIVADELGIAPADVTVSHGDTDAIPYGVGTYASRNAVVAGSAALVAAQRVRARALQLAAHLLEADVADLELAQGVRSGAIAEVWQREPPRIAITPNPALGAPVLDGEKLHIEGSASVPAAVAGAQTRLRDVFIFANDQKVFFKVVPESSGATRVEFAADVPLKVGNNTVTIFAREDEEFQARRTFYVNRRGTAEVAQGVQGEARPVRPQ